MRRVSLQVAANSLELSRLAAEHFVRLATESQNKKQLFKVVLSGGSTPKALYELLATKISPIENSCPGRTSTFFGETSAMFPPTTLTATIAWQAKRCCPEFLFP